MKGERNHRLIASQKPEGEGTISSFDLYNLGSYPGIKASAHTEHIVHGEVYLVDDQTLEQVNILEGEGSLYILQTAEVTMEGGTVTAGVYVYNHECRESARIHSGCWKQQNIYMAYGSNMDSHQMLGERCPTAKLLGCASMRGYRLAFRENRNDRVVATILEDPDASVPVVLWAIDDACEKELDRREGVALDIYRRKTVYIDFRGEEVPALVYIMAPGGKAGRPQDLYYNKILRGYTEHGIDPAPLIEAASEA